MKGRLLPCLGLEATDYGRQLHHMPHPAALTGTALQIGRQFFSTFKSGAGQFLWADGTEPFRRARALAVAGCCCFPSALLRCPAA